MKVNLQVNSKKNFSQKIYIYKLTIKSKIKKNINNNKKIFPTCMKCFKPEIPRKNNNIIELIFLKYI